ncbi:NADH-quinone oxidoreductase subunit C [Alkalilimnicola ehrlichii]|uniref:NADH-quinone oxidoreductase subunit C n=1 Tax=Alkalilimnicola ehrlichii TaxID=351052 RepID=A0A3E0X119_9GAMM|nr:NADH-quinone oxidoreductase subunit C [Alkalilimnicola ehrlichii]RFA38121.1 NADH-quinone oxidoreductase subunit C [Alkalilimnicola ehrlichii]
MGESTSNLSERLSSALGDRVVALRAGPGGELTLELKAADLYEAMLTLRDHESLRFEQLIDVAGVDYAAYGQDEWVTEQASGSGFSRGVDGYSTGRLGLTGVYGLHEVKSNTGRRFASVYHLLSIAHNERLRVRVYAEDDNFPVVASVTDIWAAANWFERESFDLFGILYEGHPDLRRILTDYGFVGHPFRKDFPLIGNVEVRYDEEKGRVVYQPVTIEPRVLVPRVVRADNRYASRVNEERTDG